MYVYIGVVLLLMYIYIGVAVLCGTYGVGPSEGLLCLLQRSGEGHVLFLQLLVFVVAHLQLPLHVTDVCTHLSVCMCECRCVCECVCVSV